MIFSDMERQMRKEPGLAAVPPAPTFARCCLFA